MRQRATFPWVALLVGAVVLCWAAYTQHVWEDYYITYRASRNLAVGHGLTFTVGERVHSFTSPLGVLLPALASLLTGNTSDVAALWIFRVLCAIALAGAVALVRRVYRQCSAGTATATLATILILSDAKIVDYTINGMETPILLFFLAWTWWALVTAPARAWLHLGLAWAGLMWTRPDAFVYVGALALGTLLFRPTEAAWRDRLRAIRGYFGAGLLTTALYLPWLLWAWAYYGTPVPHTITAKGLLLPTVTAASLWDRVTRFPGGVARDPSILAGTFTPAYSYTSGWSPVVLHTAFALALVAILLWLVPRLRWEARVASFTAAVGQLYLYSFVGFATPWYLPPVAFFALIALSLAWGQWWAHTASRVAGGRSWWRTAPGVVAALWAFASVLLALATAHQLRLQQAIIEDGQRRQIGLWLHDNARTPADTVFLEPLGYIGYFSGLKMLDYPGLCAPEVVAARRRASSTSYPFCWSELIMDLQPDWLVLRPYESKTIRDRDPVLFARYYESAKVFDVRDKVAAIAFLPGRGYLVNDAVFEIYRRRDGWPKHVGLHSIVATALTRNENWGQPAYDSEDNLVAHAPSLLEYPKPARARWLSGGFGLFEGAYTDHHPGTDGAVFAVRFVDTDGHRTLLFERALAPATTPADRGTQPFRVELPVGVEGHVELAISAGPSGSNAFDWTYWNRLTFELPRP